MRRPAIKEILFNGTGKLGSKAHHAKPLNLLAQGGNQPVRYFIALWQSFTVVIPHTDQAQISLWLGQRYAQRLDVRMRQHQVLIGQRDLNGGKRRELALGHKTLLRIHQHPAAIPG